MSTRQTRATKRAERDAYLAHIAGAATASEGAAERYPAFQLAVWGLVSHRHRDSVATARGKFSVKRLAPRDAVRSVAALERAVLVLGFPVDEPRLWPVPQNLHVLCFSMLPVKIASVFGPLRLATQCR